MTNVELIEGLTTEERQLLIAALQALRSERSKAWNEDCDKAEVAGKRKPSLKTYGIDQIKHMARRLGGSATHWLEDEP